MTAQWIVDYHYPSLTKNEPPRHYMLQLPWMILRLHRSAHHDPDQWLLSCAQVGLMDQELKARDVGQAKVEAVAVVREYLGHYVDAMKDVPADALS